MVTTALLAQRGEQAQEPPFRGHLRLTTRICEDLGYALFFSMLFLPTTYQIPKAALLATVCLLIAGRAIIVRRAPMHRVTLIWVLAYVLVGILFILLGVLREAPGAFRVATVYVAWPIAYLILLTGASTFRRLIVLNSMIVIGAIAIGLYALSHVLTSLGVLPSWLYIPLDQGQYVVQGSGWIAIRLLSSTTLFFALPYTIASLMLVQLAGHSIIKTRWLWRTL